ncbi:MAG: VOC family protein [SAR324 cluster bacterium]|nr:VOC family protein [SAR324 cluster bacterium]
MGTRIDHLVIGADNLEQGVSFVRELLGIDIPYGGVHPQRTPIGH